MSATEQLKAARVSKGKSIREVAKAAGLHENTIHNAEKGYASPSLSIMEAWAAVLGLQIVLTEDATKITASQELEVVV